MTINQADLICDWRHYWRTKSTVGLVMYQIRRGVIDTVPVIDTAGTVHILTGREALEVFDTMKRDYVYRSVRVEPIVIEKARSLWRTLKSIRKR